MKRKQPPREERRTNLAETNLLDQPKRIDVRRRWGCGPFLGTLMLLGFGVVGWAILVH